jgi:SNF2 family DNA or RNA helicase
VPGVLQFDAIDQARRIRVSRTLDVPDDFWRKVRAEWGQSGDYPSRAVDVAVEVFAGRQAWLPGACRDYGVKIVLDETTRGLVRAARRARERLREVTSPAFDVATMDDALERLVGTGYSRKLRDFQLRDLAHMLSLDHGANFSVPGAGKTSVELAVFAAELASGRVRKMLVIAPLSAFDAWIEDAKACIDPPPSVHRFTGASIPSSVDIVLVNYQRLYNAYQDVARWVQRQATLVVLDEAHRMKRGRDGEWGAACLDLAFLAARRDILTGTPAPQHPSDLLALFDYLWPGQAARLIPSGALVPQPSGAAVSEVTSAIAPLFVRTTKSELDLPPVEKTVIPVPLTGLQRQIYESLRSKFSSLARSQRERVELAAWGNVIMYLLEAATNPALLPAGSSSSDPIEFRHPPLPLPDDPALRDLIADFASYETPPKFIQVAALVDESAQAGRKVLVWSNFVRNLETLERMLARHNPALIHGGIPSELTTPGAPRTREQELAKFRTDPSCAVLLANPAAMAEGVSLHQVCHEAVYLDRTFNAGQYLQSLDRIHRLGLDPGTITRIRFLVTADTIDEIVTARIDVKATNLGIMLNDPAIATMALPDEEDVGSPIDVGDDADIAALFAHLRGD